MKKKYARKGSTLQVVAFLSDRGGKNGETQTNVLKAIARKASKAIEIDGLGVLIKYQIKKEVLELEKQLLESKLQNLTKVLVSVGDLK